MIRVIYLSIFSLILCSLSAQENTNENKFKQLKQELPTPNSYRTASGSPGPEYWQVEADYDMKLTLNDEKQQLYGIEKISFHNNSPDDLKYLWLQLDQNVRAKDSDSHFLRESKSDDRTDLSSLSRIEKTFDGGFKIDHVKDKSGKALNYTINKTMMRIDMPQTLKAGQSYDFEVKWWYNINNTRKERGRSGYEHFPVDSNNVYVIAQFFPRMCSYNDVEGWQNKQFLGRGEFTLIFGDYNVEITVPSDHLVSATGTLTNESNVLSATQKKRLAEAKNEYTQPVIIASLEEADERMKSKASNTKTWKYSTDNVRDFAFASSRRFIWDAMAVPMKDGRKVMAASMYVKEGDCLWSQYSTKAVAHTIKWYSHYTFDYPYPIAWSIDGSMGMEYPMICFNYGRCESDNTYTQRMKYGHIGVIIHEVGHNWFPMIVNSDERQWTWMDEGLNTYVQFLTEQHWEENYPSRRGKAKDIVRYMGGDKSKISPIMTNSESIFQFGNNAYGKPATALNILRETVVGREIFDFAFREYSNRWKFKHPMPADFFRTLEDASAVDLDWFWRGWFYTNDHVDIAMTTAKELNPRTSNPVANKMAAQKKRAEEPENITDLRNKKEITKTRADDDPSILDFYSKYDPLESDIIDEETYAKYLKSLSPEERAILESEKTFYELSFENIGGLVMPIIFNFEYVDGTIETFRLPPEVWRMGNTSYTKIFPAKMAVKQIVLDPYLETADVDRTNNYFPKKEETSRFRLFKEKRSAENPMQRAARAKKKGEDIKP